MARQNGVSHVGGKGDTNLNLEFALAAHWRKRALAPTCRKPSPLADLSAPRGR
jgi:hypothetical protein